MQIYAYVSSSMVWAIYFWSCWAMTSKFVFDMICKCQHFSYSVYSFMCIKSGTYWYHILYSTLQSRWILCWWCSCSSNLLLTSFPLCELSSPGVFKSLNAEWCPWSDCQPRGHCCLHSDYISLQTRSLSWYRLELKCVKYP